MTEFRSSHVYGLWLPWTAKLIARSFRSSDGSSHYLQCGVTG